MSRKGVALRLGCIGKQGSDENPLMRKVAEPLRLTQSQVNNVGTLLNYPLGGALHCIVTFAIRFIAWLVGISRYGKVQPRS